MGGPSSITAYVLGYNNAGDTIECLRSLLEQTVPLRLFYFDNGSEPVEREAVVAAFSELEVVAASENKGFSRGWNAGLSHALQTGADYVLAANNDLVFAPDAVERLLACAERHSGAGVVTPRILYHAEPERVWSAGLKRRGFPPALVHRKTKAAAGGVFTDEEEVDSLTLCTVLLRAAAVKEVGLLDPSFFFYCEDTDYAERMRAAGHSLFYAPDSKVWHKAPPIGSGRRSERMWRHLGRSERLFCRKHPQVFGAATGLHIAYLKARTLLEGGVGAWRAFGAGLREGGEAELLPVPGWSEGV